MKHVCSRLHAHASKIVVVATATLMAACPLRAGTTVCPAPSRNEDVCSQRLRNLCSERLDGDGSLIRESIVDHWPNNAPLIASDRITTLSIAMKTELRPKW